MLPIYLMNLLFAISTTIGMTIIPLLITDGLGYSLFVLGIIEGSTEFISNILRLITGNVFDRLKNRRLLFVLPSILAFISKLVLCMPGAATILISKLLERIANGAFAAPRDAYIGENAKSKGLALGFLSFSKTLGCIIGPLTISFITKYFGPLNNYLILVIILACLVNFICLGLACSINTARKMTLFAKNEFIFSEFGQTLKNLRFIFILAFLFFLGRFNDGVIMLHLKSQNFPEWFYQGTIAYFNLAMLVVSPFLGLAMDKGWRVQILIMTILALLGFNLFFINVTGGSWFLAILGLICWGVQRAGAQIAFSALIFKNSPTKFYGTALGVYSLISGLAIFIASGLSGILASAMSFQAAFLMSGIFSMLSLLMAGYMVIKR